MDLRDSQRVLSVEDLRALPFPTAADRWDLYRVVRYDDGEEVVAYAGDQSWAQYGRNFLLPHPEFRCVGCGSPLLDSVMGTFYRVFGDEGFCSVCHYPCRQIHYLRLLDGTSYTLPTLMQYHPHAIKDSACWTEALLPREPL
jgi:hypothetical protein